MGARKIVASGYLVMPQSGDGSRWQLSAPVLADLDAERSYTIHIRQDEVARNMSYLEHNERYTAWPGGGDAEHNHANIASIQLRMLGR